ncbi:hypothetical protein AJ80_04314 [Polytolypa hystricis UAMH7299]|uniref:Mitochondrial protein Fmp25 n=1 Tax=Polytolypa hystricis (strain UAMH7299) TaxID=1447883 RepID=A0A2B7YBH7_POLH7|nr:hypothetical protein AJ80_04314 [Polytolypa hystricis UAMH7299]
MFSRGSKQLLLERGSIARSLPRSARTHYQRYSSNAGPSQPKRTIVPRWILPYAAVGGVTAVGSFVYLYLKDIKSVPAPKEPPPVEVVVEEKILSRDRSKEENKEALSPQHLQVKKSWENPGVYAWGSNLGGVANPDSKETTVKTPQRIPYFDGMLLRDLKLDRNFGAAISEHGDLIQWGKGYSRTSHVPSKTLVGKNLVSICILRDRVVALSSGGDVYSLPVSKTDQESGTKPYETSWIPFWKNRASLSYRRLRPQLGLGEKVTAISGGLEHVLLLTSSGRVYSAACGAEHYPSRGQLGIPGLKWSTRPAGPYDICHEVSALHGLRVTDIAAGDYHSLARDKQGRVFVFGDNSSGQLGLPTDPSSSFLDTPTIIPLQKLYSGKGYDAKTTSIAAGGANSFFMVDAKRILGKEETATAVRDLGRVTKEVWSCGNGLYGNLGSGRWTHIQDAPTKVRALSGLMEFDDKTQKVVPIGVSNISVGSTHASAVLGNKTNVGASAKSSQTDTNYGSDVLFWGGNEFFQLGTGKRNNVPAPQYISPPSDVEISEPQRQEHRWEVTPRRTVKLGGRKVSFEQRVECGRFVTAVYSAV